jgi:RNA polymerase sigma-70 factor (ECF subfamily)
VASSESDRAGAAIPSEDRRTLEALRRGDENAFLALVNKHHATMLRVASAYVSSHAVAEEVVQEAWLGLLKGLGSFEGRSSLRSWIFGILSNCAKSRAVREARTTPLSEFADPDDDEPAVDPSRFLGAEHPRWPGHWAAPPEAWAEEKVLAKETVRFIAEEIERLPATQRQVVTLRDVEGWSSAEICAALGITEGNERVLLHRARSRIRAALERRLGEERP